MAIRRFEEIAAELRGLPSPAAERKRKLEKERRNREKVRMDRDGVICLPYDKAVTNGEI